MQRETRDQVSHFCHQYLQLERNLDYPESSLLREEETQEFIFGKLFSARTQNYPPPIRYQLRVIKELISKIESSIEDWDKYGVSENLISCLSDLLSVTLPSEAAAAQQKSYVTYHQSLLPARPSSGWSQITLLESRSLIAAGGTTGLRTWEASLHLGQYLCAEPHLIQGKRIVELGTGTGYLSILCAKYLEARHVIASDGSDDVINNLPDSFFLNDLQGSPIISAMDLKWGHALVGTEEQQWNGGREIDLVLGADITYDARVIPALVATLEELVTLFPKIAILIAATERNKETFESFLTVCAKVGFETARIDFPVPLKAEQRGPFYDDRTPIHICELAWKG